MPTLLRMGNISSKPYKITTAYIEHYILALKILVFVTKIMPMPLKTETTFLWFNHNQHLLYL